MILSEVSALHLFYIYILQHNNNTFNFLNDINYKYMIQITQ